MPRRLLFSVLVVGLLALTGCTDSVGLLAGDTTFNIEYTPPEEFQHTQTESNPPTHIYEAGDGDVIIYSQTPHDKTQETFFSNDTIKTMNGVYRKQNREGSVAGPHTTRFQNAPWLVMNISIEGSRSQEVMVFATADDEQVYQFSLYAAGNNVDKRYSAFTTSVRNVSLTK